MESTRTHRGIAGRSVLLCPAGECIVLHYSLRSDFKMEMTHVLRGDLATAEDDGRVINEEGDRWSVAAAYHPTTFNCCTYAVGDFIGLTPRDWIEPRPTVVTYFTQPMQIILDSYFSLVKSIPAPVTDWRLLAADQTLRENDVLCFWLGSEQPRPLEELPEIVHAGRLRKRRGQNWLVSKMRGGPIVLGTIRATAAEFGDRFDEIRIYRFDD